MPIVVAALMFKAVKNEWHTWVVEFRGLLVIPTGRHGQKRAVEIAEKLNADQIMVDLGVVLAEIYLPGFRVWHGAAEAICQAQSGAVEDSTAACSILYKKARELRGELPGC